MSKLIISAASMALCLSGVSAGAADEPSGSGAAATRTAEQPLSSKMGPLSKIGTTLSTLYREHQSGGQRSQAMRGSATEEALRSGGSSSVQMVGDLVSIDAVADGDDAEALAQALQELGAQDVSSYGRVVSGLEGPDRGAGRPPPPGQPNRTGRARGRPPRHRGRHGSFLRW